MPADDDVSFLSESKHRSLSYLKQVHSSTIIKIIHDKRNDKFVLPQPESEVFEITDFTTASEWER